MRMTQSRAKVPSTQTDDTLPTHALHQTREEGVETLLGLHTELCAV